MKNFFKIICLCLVVILSGNSVILAEDIYTYEAPEYTCEKRIISTPYTEIALMNLISDKAISVSNQIYDNLLKRSVDLFRLTDEGIREINPWKTMTEEELDYVKNLAEEINKDCTTTDEIIRNTAEYIAKNICYDYDYLDGKKEYEEVPLSPYDVLASGFTVCYGYATAFNAILQAKGIPCIVIISPNHAWSMAYNGNKWILIDTTWMSGGYMYEGVLYKSSVVRDEWYDYSIDTANAEASHLIEEADYTEYDNCIFTFPRYTSSKKFEIPENITRVENQVFYGCSEIEITFDGLFESVGRIAFYKCSNFGGTLNLKKITEIGDWAFGECSSLGAVYIGENITSVPYAAFYGCTSLSKVFLDKNVKNIAEHAFGGCSGMKAFYYNGTTEEFESLRKSTDPGNNFFRFAITDYKPEINVEPDDDTGKKWSVEYIGIPLGETMLYAEYCDGKMLKVKSQLLNDSTSFVTEDKNADEIRVFVWNELEVPVCESKRVSPED